MKTLLFYAAVAVLLIAAAAYTWAKLFSSKETGPEYTEGKGRGLGLDFMDPSKADANITPIKGNLGIQSMVKPHTTDQWFGKYVAIKSTMPTSNPVRTQLKTIW